MVRSSFVRVAALLALALAALLPVGGGVAANAAPSGFPAGTLTLTMFGSDEAPSFQVEEGLIAEWQKLHPNVAVQAQQAPLGPSFQKLVHATAQRRRTGDLCRLRAVDRGLLTVYGAGDSG